MLHSLPGLAAMGLPSAFQACSPHVTLFDSKDTGRV
jgi:hypothetical protein